jgi:hypothetical protein
MPVLTSATDPWSTLRFSRSKMRRLETFRCGDTCTCPRKPRVTGSSSRMAPDRIATLRCSSRWPTRSAMRASLFFDAICHSGNCARTAHREATTTATSRVCVAPSNRCARKFTAASFSAAIPMADARHRFSWLLNLVSPTRCCCSTPALFVQGARDAFGTLEELTAALRLIPARTQLLPIDSAGHELMTARNRAGLPLAIATVFASLVESRS